MLLWRRIVWPFSYLELLCTFKDLQEFYTASICTLKLNCQHCFVLELTNTMLCRRENTIYFWTFNWRKIGIFDQSNNFEDLCEIKRFIKRLLINRRNSWKCEVMISAKFCTWAYCKKNKMCVVNICQVCAVWFSFNFLSKSS